MINKPEVPNIYPIPAPTQDADRQFSDFSSQEIEDTPDIETQGTLSTKLSVKFKAKT